MLSPEGSALTNESVCEVMLSCFRICFEPRLNELLRRTAEHALKDIILLLFMRLPQFAEERNAASLIKKLKMVANGGIEQTTKRRKTAKASNKVPPNKQQVAARATPPNNRSDELKTDKSEDPSTPNQLLVPPKEATLATTPSTPIVGNIVDMQGKFMQTPQNPSAVSQLAVSPEDATINLSVKPEGLLPHEDSVENDADVEENDCDNVKSGKPDSSDAVKSDDVAAQNDPVKGEDFVNSMGVRFTPQSENGSFRVQIAIGTIELILIRYLFSSKCLDQQAGGALAPYGLPCIRELLRFLISLCNPLDKQNTDAMIHMGLSMLTIALEVGADSIGKYDTLLEMVKDDLCKNLFAVCFFLYSASSDSSISFTAI